MARRKKLIPNPDYLTAPYDVALETRYGLNSPGKLSTLQLRGIIQNVCQRYRPKAIFWRLAFWYLRRSFRKDPEFAWTWFCNIAMPIYDNIHNDLIYQMPADEWCNLMGARIMEHLFQVNMQFHPHYREQMKHNPWAYPDGCSSEPTPNKEVGAA